MGADEQWRLVPGYGGRFSVSSKGRVARNVPCSHSSDAEAPCATLRIKRTHADRLGYLRVGLRCPIRRKNDNRLVHQLVLEAFHGPRPPGMVGCHNDGNNQNNDPANLRWDTPAANAIDSSRHGVLCRGSDVWSSKLVQEQVQAIRADRRSQRLIAAQYGVTQSVVSRIQTGKAWAHATLE